MAGSILVIGLGDLGFHILQFLIRVPGVSTIVAADVDDEIGLVKTRDAIFGASQQGSIRIPVLPPSTCTISAGPQKSYGI